MSEPMPILFVDRDGTLIEEPADRQVDSIAKVRFMPGVFAALARLRARGFRLVMVTNQDGLGSAAFPREAFEGAQAFVLQTFASQGIEFEAVFICPHVAGDDCRCRKPRTALVDAFLERITMEPTGSAMVGDRDTDLEFARNLGIRGLKVQREGAPSESWDQVAASLLARRGAFRRCTEETDVEVFVDLDANEPLRVSTGIGFFDHMLEQTARHGGFALTLACRGDLRVDEHHTVEDCALALGSALRSALGDKIGIARFGFLLPMDEARAQVAIDLSGRPFARFEGRFAREQVGGLPTELVAHFFQSLAQSLGAAIHVQVNGDNAHHMIEACFKGVGRALRQAFRLESDTLPSTKGRL